MSGGPRQAGTALSQTGSSAVNFRMCLCFTCLYTFNRVLCFSYQGTETEHVRSVLSEQAQVGAHRLRVHRHLF